MIILSYIYSVRLYKQLEQQYSWPAGLIAGFCDWPPQGDVRLHFSQSSLCFNFSQQSRLFLWPLWSEPLEPERSNHSQQEWEDWLF